MLVSSLIVDAYRFGKIFPVVEANPDSERLTDGLRLLNYIIDEMNIDGKEVVLNASFTIDNPTTPYPLKGWIEISSATYRIGSVETPMEIVSLDKFMGTSYIRNVKSIPYLGYFQRSDLDGFNLNFYFDPDEKYPITINGLKSIDKLTLNDDINVKAKIYKVYLLERLIQNLRAYNSKPDDPRNIAAIANLENKLSNIKDVNTMVECSPFVVGSGDVVDTLGNAAYEANIFQGWRP